MNETDLILFGRSDQLMEGSGRMPSYNPKMSKEDFESFKNYEQYKQDCIFKDA